jgi:hypothetical protein
MATEILHFEISSDETIIANVFVNIWSMISGIVLKFTAKTYDDTVPIYKIVLDFIMMNGGIY